MAKSSKHLVHPILGTLDWVPRYSYWFSQPILSTGVQIDLVVDPYDSDRYEFLPRAAELFQWAIANQRAIFDRAVKVYLLKLYNEGWRQDDSPVLDAAGFTAHLKWECLQVSSSDTVPIEYGYNPGDLFGGHTVKVEVDNKLKYRGATLIG